MAADLRVGVAPGIGRLGLGAVSSAHRLQDFRSRMLSNLNGRRRFYSQHKLGSAWDVKTTSEARSDL